MGFENGVYVARPTDCPECGTAAGEDCYRMCSRHPDYYSAEREHDDAMFSESLSDGEHWSAAHAEWHHTAGVPMGTPGCPWDACHDDDEGRDDPVDWIATYASGRSIVVKGVDELDALRSAGTHAKPGDGIATVVLRTFVPASTLSAGDPDDIPF